jgi:hypothetical protein
VGRSYGGGRGVRSYGGGRNVEGIIHESYLISDSLRIKIFSAHKTRSGKAKDKNKLKEDLVFLAAVVGSECSPLLQLH